MKQLEAKKWFPKQSHTAEPGQGQGVAGEGARQPSQALQTLPALPVVPEREEGLSARKLASPQGQASALADEVSTIQGPSCSETPLLEFGA